MKIDLTNTTIPTRKRGGASKALLPGEPRPFTPMTKSTVSSLRNLTPAQHLDDSGTITSIRKHEVTCADPLLQRIRELEAENATLRKQLQEGKAQ